MQPSKPGFCTRLVADVPKGQEGCGDLHSGVVVKEQKPAVHEPHPTCVLGGVTQSSTVLQEGGDGGEGDGGGGDGGGGDGGGGDGGGDMKIAYRFMAA